ncbi:cytidine deaminase [Williamsoniiplasma somnilux]|nr:cytidine deaminase [Williamsoniiplasma somnilux]
MDKKEIFDELLNLAKQSYSPYSHFRVSCILFLKNHQKIKGVNVENAAYSPTICAERTALSQLITQGYNCDDIEVVALYTDATQFGSPCGVCRQVMSELLNENQKVWIFSKKGFASEHQVKEFLPYAFGKNEL